jgi:NADH:ubiquinone oxidoreductase subunit 6 (subunit J)
MVLVKNKNKKLFSKILCVRTPQFALFTTMLIKKHHFSWFKWALILFVHLIGFFALFYVATWFMVYIGFIGVLSSHILFLLLYQLSVFVLPITIILLSGLVILNTNPVYSLICLILVFFSAVIFLLSINVNFLAMIYLIIYIGAIAILFLFVIMMFNLRTLKQQQLIEINGNGYNFLSFNFFFYCLILWKFYAMFLDHVLNYIEYNYYFTEFANTQAKSLRYFLTYQHVDALLFGTLLYTYYSYLFLLAAFILLTAMLGSIVLALSTTENINKSSANNI